MVMTRSVSLTRANAQGAGGAGNESSSLFGSYAQITGEGNREFLGISQGLEIGRGIFDASFKMSEFISQANKAGTDINLANAKLQTVQNKYNAKLAAAGAASSSAGTIPMMLGSSIMQNLGTIDSLGTSALFGKSNTPYYSNASNGYFYTFGADDPYQPVY
jgi:hypothetical protein